jgi:hypothetical protein
MFSVRAALWRLQMAIAGLAIVLGATGAGLLVLALAP